MSPEALEKLKFPIGKFHKPATISKEQVDLWITEISTFPQRLATVTQQLSATDWETPYRPEGWNARQVVHHCADSHMNSFIRFKLALTENHPSIKPYMEDVWAEGPDYAADPNISLALLQALHQRWVILLRSLGPSDLDKTFFHPESHKIYTLAENIGIYAWHGNHHLAHVQSILDLNGRTIH